VFQVHRHARPEEALYIDAEEIENLLARTSEVSHMALGIQHCHERKTVLFVFS
jgi:hypothetical protein